ncbi:hypothetical protein [Rhizosphaericola mali]|uniref:Uncharacterized protein n=1 Tax=Rhizosphaericola mali TaxID=2545455 RepID=A0A5P2FWT4_9BACT|nr:hypothetical protein [Rhizosphaericola mali]QES87367.1 hypothetical protein E0W69_001395 [Rhizosphaericola mali]
MLTISKNSKARSVIMAAAAVLAIGGAMAKNIQTTKYRYNGSTPQSAGSTISQNASDYSVINSGTSYGCDEDDSKICSYSRNASGQFVQDELGVYNAD